MIANLWQLHLEEKQRIFELTRMSAYYFWKERIRENENGSEFEDWLKAEKYVKESFPWLSNKPYTGTIHLLKRNEEFPDILICPMCAISLGENEKPVELGVHQCFCCGSILEIKSVGAHV